MSESAPDLIVIGAGPGGYVAAIRAAQLGMQVTVVEKYPTLGGTCLNVGCIPSKALLESSELYEQAQHHLHEHGITAQVSLNLKQMMARKNQVVKKLTGGIAMLFKKNRIERITGSASFNPDKSITVSQGSQSCVLKAHRVIIATGSVPATLPGLALDGETIFDSTGALALSQVPQKLLVIGAGYIGLEMGSVYRRLGSEVTVVETFDRLLPSMDQDLGPLLQKILAKQGMKFLFATTVQATKKTAQGVAVTLQDTQGTETTLVASGVLVAVGRRPLTQGLGLEKIQLVLDERGCIPVDEDYQTAVQGIHAIGDVIAGPMLAHKATEEAVVAVERIAGHKVGVNYLALPSVIYTHPEVAAIGWTEQETIARGLEIKTAKFPFAANGRAWSLDMTEGFVKLIADKKTDRLLGAHMIGPRVSEAIAEMAVALEFAASSEDIARTIHAHPTLAEAIKESALGLGAGFMNL